MLLFKHEDESCLLRPLRRFGSYVRYGFIWLRA